MFGFKKKNNETGANLGKKRGFLSDAAAVLNAIEDGVIAINFSGNIEVINPAAQNFTGWSGADAAGIYFESVLKIVSAEGRELLPQENPIKKCLANPSDFTSREYFLRTQGGKNVPIFLHINPINQQNSALVVVFRNISKELKENREQAEFISTASHEMRTPVASIEGYLGLALNPATATIDARAKSYLEKARENVKHLGQLFQDLLDISRSEDGRLKNEPVVLDAVAFSREVWDGLKPKADAKNLNYIFDLDQKKSGEKTIAPVFYIHADRDHLREILNNLFENAIKYTPHGDVSVSVSGERDWTQISVRDSGIGIPSEDLPHLFQKFYRVDNSATREIGGTGLGLYLSRRLAESMGGTLTVESELEKGSTFTLKLPRISREQAQNFLEKEKLRGDFAEKAKEGFAAVNFTSQASWAGEEKLNLSENSGQILSEESVKNSQNFIQNTKIPPAQNFEHLQPPIQQNFTANTGGNFAQNQAQFQPQTSVNLAQNPQLRASPQTMTPARPTPEQIEAARAEYLRRLEYWQSQIKRN